MATMLIPIVTSIVDHKRYCVAVNLPFVIHSSEPKGLKMLMNMIANIDTKRTIAVWFCFVSRYLGNLRNRVDVYSAIIFYADVSLYFLLQIWCQRVSVNLFTFATSVAHVRSFSFANMVPASECEFIHTLNERSPCSQSLLCKDNVFT